MKLNENTDLFKRHLQEKKDFEIYLNGEYFDTYSYDEQRNVYCGFGFIDMEKMVKAMREKDYWIQVKPV